MREVIWREPWQPLDFHIDLHRTTGYTSTLHACHPLWIFWPFWHQSSWLSEVCWVHLAVCRGQVVKAIPHNATYTSHDMTTQECLPVKAPCPLAELTDTGTDTDTGQYERDMTHRRQLLTLSAKVTFYSTDILQSISLTDVNSLLKTVPVAPLEERQSES